jgi:hypothetical protein
MGLALEGLATLIAGRKAVSLHFATEPLPWLYCSDCRTTCRGRGSVRELFGGCPGAVCGGRSTGGIGVLVGRISLARALRGCAGFRIDLFLINNNGTRGNGPLPASISSSDTGYSPVLNAMKGLPAFRGRVVVVLLKDHGCGVESG